MILAIEVYDRKGLSGRLESLTKEFVARTGI